MVNLEKLETETINENTKNIDSCSVYSIIELINNEDKKVPEAISLVKKEIASLIDAAYNILKNGGRLIYVGAGTSGRLGVLDASECPPTYGVSSDMVMGVIAGGKEAIFNAREGFEDSEFEARKDLLAINLTKKDMIVGLAASGRTPYVVGALKFAREVGAETGSIACVSNAEISGFANYPIEVITGAEVIQGSTRMKAGTAQKLVLNMISTTCMIKLGKVYGNLMVDVQPTNEKLRARALRIIEQAIDCNENVAQSLYENSNGNVKVAIVMGLLGVEFDMANELLHLNNGRITEVINLYKEKGID